MVFKDEDILISNFHVMYFKTKQHRDVGDEIKYFVCIYKICTIFCTLFVQFSVCSNKVLRLYNPSSFARKLQFFEHALRARASTHTYTHKHTYIYMYMCVYVRIHFLSTYVCIHRNEEGITILCHRKCGNVRLNRNTRNAFLLVPQFRERLLCSALRVTRQIFQCR